MNISPMGAKVVPVDRRTDMTKLIVAFRSFVNVSNKRLWKFSKLLRISISALRGKKLIGISFQMSPRST